MTVCRALPLVALMVATPLGASAQLGGAQCAGLFAAMLMVALIGDGRSAPAQEADGRPPDDHRPQVESERLTIERHFFEYLRLQGVPPPPGLGLQSLQPAPLGLKPGTWGDIWKPGATGDFWKPREFERLIGRR